MIWPKKEEEDEEGEKIETGEDEDSEEDEDTELDDECKWLRVSIPEHAPLVRCS